MRMSDDHSLLRYVLYQQMHVKFCKLYLSYIYTVHTKLTWDELVKRDRVLLGMERTDPEDRQAWRGRLRPQLGSQAATSAED